MVIHANCNCGFGSRVVCRWLDRSQVARVGYLSHSIRLPCGRSALSSYFMEKPVNDFSIKRTPSLSVGSSSVRRASVILLSGSAIEIVPAGSV